MTEETVSLLLNPVAGRGRAGRRLSQIERIFDAAGMRYEVCLSSAVGDIEAQAFARSAGGQDTIIVAGGDGSIHEAVNGMVRAGGGARLGVIPVGTGNDFAKASGIVLDWEKAASSLCERLARRGPAHAIDVGRMNDRYFANGAGIGFDAKVTRIARSYRMPMGDLVYLLAIFRAMADGIATPSLHISADDFEWTGPVTLANVANGPWVGGMFHIAPTARNDDGRLDLIIADPVSRARICALLPRVVRGRHLTEPEITHTSVRRLTIEAEAAMPSHLDGEVQPPATRFEIEVLPAALNLL
jgi:YegS/Rv2252/BmrU family lipid kinase